MKTIKYTMAIMYILSILGALNAMSEAGSPPPSSAVFFLDDFTGIDPQHGIERAEPGGLTALCRALIGSNLSFFYSAIGEEARSQPIESTQISSFSLSPPQKPSTEGLTLPQLKRISKAYFEKKDHYNRELAAWWRKTFPKIQEFTQKAIAAQMATEERFDLEMVARGDFRRSAVADAVLVANKTLRESNATFKVLILNTDAVDSPNGKRSRTAPFTVKELDPTVYLVFVNRSEKHKPQESSLFKGISNPISHADSVDHAASVIARLHSSRQRGLANR